MTLSTRNFPVVTYKDDEALNRSSYRLKLLLFGLLPYAYIFAILAPIVTLFVLLIWTIISGAGRDGAGLRIQLALAVVAALFLRSILVRVPPPPRGLTLPGKEPSATLLTLAHEIARAIRGPKVHAIRWSDEFDLSIVAVPRMSLPGWAPRYYLKIGIPLMHALSPEQFRARLAHELGLFAGAHGRFRSWLYRRRFIWPAVLSVLTYRGRWGSWLFSRFFHWYVRSFIDYANDAFRYHVYEADRSAADVTSAEITAAALIRIECGSYLQNEFWDKDYDEARKTEDDYTHIAALLKRSLSDNEDEWAGAKAREWVECELEESTDIRHAHPVLQDRLAALGQAVRVPGPIAQTAAEVYLEDYLFDVTEALKQAERERIGLAWQPDSPDSDAALEAYGKGTELLREDQEEGVTLLERAMELDPNLTSTACGQLSAYYIRRGDIITSLRYSRRSTSHWLLDEKTRAERGQVSFSETFVPHEFSAWEIEQLRTELTKHKEIKEAYLVRKQVTYRPEKPLHSLGLVLDRAWFSTTPADLSFAKRLPPAKTNPPELYTFVLDYKNRRLGNIIRNIPDSLIYKNSTKNDGTK